jgi:hypothetical protein
MVSTAVACTAAWMAIGRAGDTCTNRPKPIERLADL